MKRLHFLLLPLLFLSACKTFRSTTGSTNNHQIDITFIQMNDVYEIAPLSGGREGGIARIATLKKEALQKNKNTYLVMAGDFLSPSVYNSLKYEGKAIRGRQMVAALNSAGLDIAMFGNHEFDIREQELQERMAESGAQWLSTNSFHKTKEGDAPFVQQGKGPLPATYILHVTDEDGTAARVGFIAVTLPFNRAEYVSYTNPLQAAKEAYNQLKDSVDAVVAITHQSIQQDIELAKELPGLAAIIGGHEHDGRYAKIGNVIITKSLANARNAYFIHLRINTKKHTHKITTQLKPVNETIALDSVTNTVVQKWVAIANAAYSASGFVAPEVVIDKGAPLDGRETEVRTRPTNLTQLVVAAMKEAAPGADIVLLNGGSVRVDDVVGLPVTQYDILRSLPFGGAIAEADMKGSVVMKMLEAGRKNMGTGGFLHYNESLVYAADKWMLNGQPLDAAKVYHVAMPEFLLSGKEANMEFVNPTNVDVMKVYAIPNSVTDSRSDVRLAIITFLQKAKSNYRQQ